MKYSEMLSEAVERSGLKLIKITDEVKKITGKNLSKEYLSRLKSGKIPPASDQLNEALAKVLGIDHLELKTAAYIEKIPPDILKNLLKQSSA